MKSLRLAILSSLLAVSAAFAQDAAPAARTPASPRGFAATQIAGHWSIPTDKPGASPKYQDGKWITVDYGRPILRGRAEIFGNAPEYGRKVRHSDPVWRAGANATTRLRTEAALALGGRHLAAGDYSVFVDLKEGSWTLVFSTQAFQPVRHDEKDTKATWGALNYDAKFDILRVPMKVSRSTDSFDQFGIDFINMTQEGGTLAMRWEKTVATVDFRLAK
jgi:hypothetical protein